MDTHNIPTPHKFTVYVGLLLEVREELIRAVKGVKSARDSAKELGDNGQDILYPCFETALRQLVEEFQPLLLGEAVAEAADR